MSNEKLLARLRALNELTKIRPEEEGDEARLNEARSAAFLLLKTARENGVAVVFRAPKADGPVADPRGESIAHPKTDFEDALMRVEALSQMLRDVGHATAPAAPAASAVPAPMRVNAPHVGVCVACGQAFLKLEAVWCRSGRGYTHFACGTAALTRDASR